MKKIVGLLTLVVVLGLFTACGKDETVSFNPIPKRQVTTGNYTDYAAEKNTVIECQQANLQQMVGMTFRAFPADGRPPFSPKDGGYVFSVKSPEKFKVESVEGIRGVSDQLKASKVNIRFESGKTAYINVSLYPLFGGFLINKGGTYHAEGAIPDFIKCLKKIEDACGEPR